MIDLDDISFVGTGLERPECVLATESGTLHVADWRGGVTLIHADGRQRQILAKGRFKPKPNGIAIHPDGGWLLAHLGDNEGGVFWLRPDGSLVPFIHEVDGMALPPTNYVHIDAHRRIWVTVSTRVQPRSQDYRPDAASGFIVLVDNAGPRIVGDRLGYANECAIHPVTGALYVNETFARRLTRFDVADGALVGRGIVAEFGDGTYPDGLTFDQEGGIWITSLVSNRVVRVHADGHQETLLEDTDDGFIADVESAFQDGRMDRPHLATVKGRKLRNITSLAFGGPKRRTAYLGCLLGKSIACFTAPVAGLVPSHWYWDGLGEWREPS